MKLLRFWLCTLLLLTGTMLIAQPRRPPPHMIDPRRLNAEEGEVFLQSFRASGIPAPFSFRFQIEHMPRRGPSITYAGQLWGVWHGSLSLSRIRLREDGATSGDWLLLSDGNPRVWRGGPADNDGPIELTAEQMHRQSFVPGTSLTAFDLLMPFIHWNDYVYEGSGRIRGRPVHRFIFYPPADDPRYAGLGGVRASIDADFNAILQTDLLDEQGSALRTLRVSRFRRVDNQWIVRQVDITDERSRDRTRFEIVAAAMNLPEPPPVFDISLLGTEPDPLPATRFETF